jgi:hypothetical protein
MVIVKMKDVQCRYCKKEFLSVMMKKHHEAYCKNDKMD